MPANQVTDRGTGPATTSIDPESGSRGPSGEFSLIARYFNWQQETPVGPDDGLLLPNGDDAALVQPPPGEVLAVSCDTLVAGSHFRPDCDPRALGHKALAVNLSDLAAMGAQPRWCLLALTLPGVDHGWLAAFSAGFRQLAEQHQLWLIGGDTTRGPLSITVTILGTVPAGAALTRSGARPGDDLYVSGDLGGAALGLGLESGDIPASLLNVDERAVAASRLHRPTPRVALGRALRGVASAAIDISDGLAADLGHLTEASAVGATLHAGTLPLYGPLQRLGVRQRMALALGGGEDYELCFSAAAQQRATIARIATELSLPLSRIGTVQAASGLWMQQGDGRRQALARAGFDHFAASR